MAGCAGRNSRARAVMREECVLPCGWGLLLVHFADDKTEAQAEQPVHQALPFASHLPMEQSTPHRASSESPKRDLPQCPSSVCHCQVPEGRRTQSGHVPHGWGRGLATVCPERPVRLLSFYLEQRPERLLSMVGQWQGGEVTSRTQVQSQALDCTTEQAWPSPVGRTVTGPGTSLSQRLGSLDRVSGRPQPPSVPL